MKVIDYEEMIKLCKFESDNLVSQLKLKDHCKKHGISYTSVLAFIRGKKKGLNAKIAVEFLTSMGYKNIKKEQFTEFKFYFDSDDEKKLNTRLFELSLRKN